MATANIGDMATVAAIVTARIVEAKRLRRAAAQIDADYYDLLCTYNRMWDASDGRDGRLALIAADLNDMAQARRRKLDEADRLTGKRR